MRLQWRIQGFTKSVWRPFDVNAPLFYPTEVQTDIKKHFKLNNVLHFVELQEFRAGLLPSLHYRIVLTMLFFLIILHCIISFPRKKCPALLR